MELVNLIILLSVFLNILSASIAAIRLKALFNVFTFAMGGFALAGFSYLLDPFSDSGSPYFYLDLKTASYVLTFSIGFLIANLGLKTPTTVVRGRVFGKPGSGDGFFVVFVGAFTFVLLSFLLLMNKNGWVPPILRIAESTGTHDVLGYGDLDVPFFTPFGIGLSRMMWAMLVFDFILAGVPLKAHFKKHKLMYLMAVAATVLVFASGRRNVLIWPIIFYLFAYVYNGKVSMRMQVRAIVVLSVTAICFTFLGNLRRGGGDFNQADFLREEHRLGLPVVDQVYAQMTRYAVCVYPNLYAMLSEPPPTSYGLVIFKETFPDRLLPLSIRQSMPAHDGISHLLYNEMLPYRGGMFRSAFTDFVPDFGFLGSLAFGVALYFGLIHIYNMSHISVWHLWATIGLLPAIFMYSLMSQFLGTVTIMPILIGLIFLGVRDRRILNTSILNSPSQRHIARPR